MLDQDLFRFGASGDSKSAGKSSRAPAQPTLLYRRGQPVVLRPNFGFTTPANAMRSHQSMTPNTTGDVVLPAGGGMRTPPKADPGLEKESGTSSTTSKTPSAAEINAAKDAERQAAVDADNAAAEREAAALKAAEDWKRTLRAAADAAAAEAKNQARKAANEVKTAVAEVADPAAGTKKPFPWWLVVLGAYVVLK